MHTLENLRLTLLAQHERIRRGIEKIRPMIELSRGGQLSREELDARLRSFADELLTHNRCEEALLGDIISTIDAWGPLRAEGMLDAHIAEHQELARELSATAAETNAASRATRLSAMLDGLLEHIDHEERTFLSESVLCDGLAARSLDG